MTIEATMIEILKKVNTLQAKVADHDRRLVVAPLNAGASKVSSIASGAVAATRPYIHLVPESGITDTLDSISNGSDGKMIVVANSRVGDTITINPHSVGGGNIDLGGSVDPYVMSDVHDSLILIYREDTSHWELISSGSGALGGGDPDAHAVSHQHGGDDEVATATPAANAIPKAGGSGDLDIGWINQADILTDNITTSPTNNFISDAELVKLAGIETLADVTDQANVGAAIHGAPEQVTLEAANRIALTDDGVLKYANWSTILATVSGGAYVDLTTAQNVGGIKTFTAGIMSMDQGASYSYLGFMQSAVLRGLVGISGAADQLIAGSVSGDLTIRADNRKILFSTNAGSSAALMLSSGNAQFNGQVGIGSAPLSTYPFTLASSTVGNLAALSASLAATYSSASPSASIVFNSRFTGQVADWNTAVLKWGFAAAYASAGARFALAILDSGGNWKDIFTAYGSGTTIFDGDLYVQSAASRIWGITGLAAGHTASFWYGGDSFNAISTTYGNRPLFSTFHGLIIHNYVGGAGASGPALAVQGHSSRDLQHWVDVSGNLVAKVAHSGEFTADGVTYSRETFFVNPGTTGTFDINVGADVIFYMEVRGGAYGNGLSGNAEIWGHAYGYSGIASAYSTATLTRNNSSPAGTQTLTWLSNGVFRLSLQNTGASTKYWVLHITKSQY